MGGSGWRTAAAQVPEGGLRGAAWEALVQARVREQVPGSAAEKEQAAEMVLAGLKKNTRAEYARRYDTFAKWCAARGVSAFPAEAGALEGFLTSLQGTKQTLKNYVTAISTVHKLAQERTPFEGKGSWVSRMLDARGEEDLRKPSTGECRTAIPAEGVQQVLERALQDNIDVAALRAAAVLGTGFLFYSRAGTSGATQKGDLNWDEDNLHYVVHEKHPTGSTRRQRQRSAPRRAPGVELVVRVLERWERLRPEGARSYFALRGETKVTSTVITACYRKALAEAGFTAVAPLWYGSHSVRSGGASACEAIGVLRPTIHTWGNWGQKSKDVEECYIDYSIKPTQAAMDFFFWLTADGSRRAVGDLVMY